MVAPIVGCGERVVFVKDNKADTFLVELGIVNVLDRWHSEVRNEKPSVDEESLSEAFYALVVEVLTENYFLCELVLGH